MSGVSLAWCVVYPWRPPIADCNCSESKSPSSHAFHPNHHQFLLPPYRNLCCNSDPSSLIYSPQRRNRTFPSSAIASYRLQCFLWLFGGWCFLTKILSIHSVLCHRSCFPHWTFPCALPEMQLLTRSALCRTPYTPAVKYKRLTYLMDYGLLLYTTIRYLPSFLMVYQLICWFWCIVVSYILFCRMD